MKIAIIEDQKVINIVVGDPEIVAQLFNKTQPITETTGTAWIGARFNGIKFEPRQTYPSWTWNEDSFVYEPPIPKPSNDVEWDEEKQEWILIITNDENLNEI